MLSVKILLTIFHLQKQKFGMEDDIFIDDNEPFPGEDDILHQSMYVDHISDEEYRPLSGDIPMQISYDPFKTSKSIQIMKSTLFADDDRSSDGGGSHVSIIRQYLDLPDDILPRLPLLREEVIPKRRVTLRPKVDKIYGVTGISFIFTIFVNLECKENQIMC